MEELYDKVKEKRIKFFVAVSVFAAAISAFVIILVSVLGSNGSTKNNIIVYKNDLGQVIRIGNLETVISDSSAIDFKCDLKNNRVFYIVSSSYSDGLFDLYYIEKDRSELTKPKIIDYGINKDYILNSGKIYYLKNNLKAGANEAYCCDFTDSVIEAFASNVENIYPIENSDTVFFVKKHGNERVLYKYSGDNPIEVDRSISEIHLYNDSETPHIFYEVFSKIYNGMTELYCVKAEGSPELLCDNTYSVMYDEYLPDGNLYYFTSANENISWSYVIADSYAETDKSITRPKRDSFLSILGISVEYNEKLREYQDKLVRDEIREALNESVEKGDFSAPVFTVFAYNSDGNHKITENINPQNVYTVSSFGNPLIIYENSEIVKSSTDMSTLVDIAQRSSIAEVIDYAKSIVDSSVKSSGIKISGYNDENGNVSCALNGYDKIKTSFSFSDDGNRLYAIVRDTAGERLRLYSSAIGSDLKLSPKINVNNGISSYFIMNNSIIYLKSDIGKNTGDIYKFSGDENAKLSNAANAMKVIDDTVIALKNYNNDSGVSLADYYIISDSEEKLLSSSVLVDSFVFDDVGKIAFIVNSENKRKLYVYSDGNISEITEDINEIILFN